MEKNKTVRYVDYDIEKCPRCGQAHHFWLQIRSASPALPEERVPIFGGPGVRELAFTCPTTGEIFTQELPNRSDGEIVGYSDSIDVPETPSSSVPPVTESQFSEWVKSSRTVATDFCKTMLTTSTGAVPVYFAILKYLGVEQIDSTFLARAGILPPLLFLATVVLFVLALRPQFRTLTEAEFAAFQTQRYHWLNRYMVAGTALFTIGVCLAIILFFHSLNAA